MPKKGVTKQKITISLDLNLLKIIDTERAMNYNAPRSRVIEQTLKEKFEGKHE